ncbi:hypothetical protein J1N35_037797 [Gossypium stocksii]|uniref:Pentatricopeptide repeat-containing protein n=1 Tax=Gossypium stocksii TaxID=47602 RepID=A0A9D3ZM15_9ROSI|nr:hypothetical protein J1N35_037797 [Gossypium stocksii]
MGKLNPPLLLPSIVNAGKHLSIFCSSISSSSKTIATHIQYFTKNSMSVRGSPTNFDNVDDALMLFNKMIDKYPRPSVVEFNKLLGAIVRMKHYAIVVSMYSQIELLGVPHNVYSFNILVNCYCQLGHIDFGFSVLGKMLKLGVEPYVVTLSTLINGLCKQGKISHAASLFDEMVDKGYQPNLIVYSTILNGLSKTGNTDRAVRFLRMM